MKPAPDIEPERDPESDGTGLPGFRSWRGVYFFVLGVFVVYVVLLTIFSWTFR